MAFFTLESINIKASGINKTAADSSLTESVKKARESDKTFDIFLSHSFLDAKQILVIKDEIEKMGYSVYVDWIEDKHLERDNVTKKTAKILQRRMNQCKSLFYATTENYQESKWMPWEMGYFDGIKSKVAILPVLEIDPGDERYVGTEYLGLYPYVTKTPSKNNVTELWINENPSKYIVFYNWINGNEPKLR